MSKHTVEMITHALRCSDNKIVFVDDVPNGDDCGCICPNCMNPLCAKNNPNNKIEHFFSHVKGYQECGNAEESAIHKLAKEILLEEKKITLARYLNGKVNYKVDFDKVELEYDDVITGLRPDAKCTIDGKGFLWIEFKNTHEVNQEKAKVIKENKINCIEIDLTDFIPNTIEEGRTLRDRLQDFLLNTSSNREWIYCGENERIKRENEETENRKKQNEAKRDLIRKNNINQQMIQAILRAPHLNIELENVCDYSDDCKYVIDECKIKRRVKIDLKTENFVGAEEVFDKDYDIVLKYRNPDDNIYVLVGRDNAKDCSKRRKIILYYVGNKWDSLDDPFMTSKKSVYEINLPRKLSTKLRSFVFISLLENGDIETNRFNCNEYLLQNANEHKVEYYYWGNKSDSQIKSYAKLFFKSRGLKVNACDRCNKGILGKCHINDLDRKLTCKEFVVYSQFESDYRNVSDFSNYLEKELFNS